MTREQVLAFRVRAQQLDRPSGTLADTAVLDMGVQDTGPDGGMWALAVRGVDVSALSATDLATVWTVRGAPHLYRRADLPAVAAAVSPFSDADAGKRIYGAARLLRAAGIGALAALDTVADAMRAVVRGPMVKGEVSARLTALLEPPYLRFCRPCGATHPHEMTFRLAALRAGLELQAGTSPPVLQPVPGLVPAPQVSAPYDVVRAYPRLLGPATAQHVAAYLDAPVAEVRSRWPTDAVEVRVGDETRWVLEADRHRLAQEPAEVAHLLGPFDLYLQARDRPLLVGDAARAKALWPVLGRPGAVLVDGEVVGTWRPRTSGRRLTVAVTLWEALSGARRQQIRDRAEQLAAFRRVLLAEVRLTNA